MAEIRTYVCDVCGKQKGEANHWWKILRVPGPRITVLPIDLPKRDEQAAEFHVCGCECVNRKVSELMTEGEKYL